MPTKLVVDCSTGQQTEVELTAEEIAQMEKDAEAFAAAEAERKAAEDAKAAAKAAAEKKLAALGLTADEIAALSAQHNPFRLFREGMSQGFDDGFTTNGSDPREALESIQGSGVFRSSLSK